MLWREAGQSAQDKEMVTGWPLETPCIRPGSVTTGRASHG